jgi:hypothetical protein
MDAEGTLVVERVVPSDAAALAALISDLPDFARSGSAAASVRGRALLNVFCRIRVNRRTRGGSAG